MTKTILVPTDFSENARYAARYACRLAERNNLDIELFHCYTTTSSVFNEEEDNSSILKADVLILEWKEQLLQDFPTLQIRTTCISGLLTEVVPPMTDQGNYLLVVMGTTGAGKGKSIIWGSNASSIVSRSSVPVLAIPDAYDGFQFDNVAMLTNFKPEELETLTDYIQYIGNIPQLDLIHVYKDPHDQEHTEDLLKSWSFNIREIDGIDHVQTVCRPLDEHSSALDSVAEVVQHIIAENNYDIILVTKTRKSFFERLFRTSVSKQIALHLDRPTFFDNN